MAFVLDCSVTMAWVFPDEANEATDALRYSLISDSAVVPTLWSIQDVLVVGKALDETESQRRKMELDRMAVMLSWLGGRGCQVREESDHLRR